MTLESPAGAPVPEDNQPGHHPEHEQDQPPLEAMAARLGIPVADEAQAHQGTDETQPSGQQADQSELDDQEMDPVALLQAPDQVGDAPVPQPEPVPLPNPEPVPTPDPIPTPEPPPMPDPVVPPLDAAPAVFAGQMPPGGVMPPVDQPSPFDGPPPVELAGDLDSATLDHPPLSAVPPFDNSTHDDATSPLDQGPPLFEPGAVASEAAPWPLRLAVNGVLVATGVAVATVAALRGATAGLMHRVLHRV